MPVTRDRGGVAIATPTPRTRTASSRTATANRNDDGLAEELDRVLKMSQPKAKAVTAKASISTLKPTSRSLAPSTAGRDAKESAEAGPSRRPAAVAKTVSRKPSVPVLKPGGAGSMARTTRLTENTEAVPPNAPAPLEARNKAAPQPLTSSTSSRQGIARTPTLSSSSRSQSKQLTSIPPEIPPEWATPSGQSISARAKSAMAAINTAQNDLTLAIRAGYSVGKGTDDWSDQRVAELVGVSELATKVLREMGDRGELGRKVVEVERAAMGLIQKCLALGIYEQMMDMLVEMRPRLARLYQRGTDTTPSISHRETGASISQIWLAAAELPQPESGHDLDETTRTLLFQAIITSWIGLLALSAHHTLNVTGLFPPSKLDDRLDPLEIASQLPRKTTTSLLSSFYRHATSQASHQSSSSNAPRHLFSAAVKALTLTIITPIDGQPSKTTPGQVWSMLHQEASRSLDSSSEALAERGKLIGGIVEWIEIMVAERKEDSSKWFSGREWMSLMDLWVNLARKSGDSNVIDMALSRMTGSLSIPTSGDDVVVPRTPERQATPVNTTRPTSRLPVPSTPSLSAASSRKNRPKSAVADPESQVIKHAAGLSSTLMLMEKHKDSTTSAAAQASLGSMYLADLADALTSLTDGSSAQSSFSKALRYVELVRRACCAVIKSLPNSTTATPGPPSGLMTAAHIWLVDAVDLAEDVLQAANLDVRAIFADLQTLSTGSIDSLLALISSPTPPMQSTSASVTPSTTILAFLNRAQRVIVLARSQVPASISIDWVRCVSQAAYNQAVRYWKEHKFSDASSFARISVGSVEEHERFLRTEQAEEMATTRWMGIKEAMWRRWELVAACYHKAQDSKGYMESYGKVLSSQLPSTLEKLAELAEAVSIQHIFPDLPDLTAVLNRISQTILSDPESASTNIEALFPLLSSDSSAQMIPVIQGILMEKVAELLEVGLYKREVAELSDVIGRSVLEIYRSNEFPVRRMRVILAQCRNVISTGIAPDSFDRLMLEMDGLAIQSNLGYDKGLEHVRREYHATSLLLSIIHAQQTLSSPSETVVRLVERAMNDLRAMIIPASHPPTAKAATPERRATMSRTTASRAKQPLGRTTTVPAPRAAVASKARAVSDFKTPKKATASATRKVSETSVQNHPHPGIQEWTDLPRLIDLLTSVISLLGLLGLPLKKIEALRLARALMRDRKDMIDTYIRLSAWLGTEYTRLGKWTRATTVFNQAAKVVTTTEITVDPAVRVELHLRSAVGLAAMSKLAEAKADYEIAMRLESEIVAPLHATWLTKVQHRYAVYERAALARRAVVAIQVAQGHHVSTSTHFQAAFRLYSRAAEGISKLAPDQVAHNDQDTSVSTSNDKGTKPAVDDDDPFAIPAPKTKIPVNAVESRTKSEGKGADEPAKDETSVVNLPVVQLFGTKSSSGLQWHIADLLLGSIYDTAAACAVRGSVRDTDFFLKQGGKIAEVVKSSILQARAENKLAQLEDRLRRFENSAARLDTAKSLCIDDDGPDAIERKTILGSLLVRQQATDQALQEFEMGNKDIVGLEEGFGKKEALLPTPQKAAVTAKRSTLTGKDPLLPSTMALILRQKVWLSQTAPEGSDPFGSDELVRQIQALGQTTEDKAEELFLQGRITLLEAMQGFQSDLFMSSLTDSTIAMPMSSLKRQNFERQSTRQTTQTLLSRAQAAFSAALQLMHATGRVEDIRQVGVSLALLHALQTSLGEGEEGLTTRAADLLASTSSISLGRDLLEAIQSKFIDGPLDDLKWPTLELNAQQHITIEDYDESSTEIQLRRHWQDVSARLTSPNLATSSCLDLSPLPPHWAVISISITEDHSTLFLSRHQRDQSPVVFCLPLDRQGKREGEENPLPFQAAVDELKDIIQTSDETSRNAKFVDTSQGRRDWWEQRYALDKRLEELCSGIEDNWLGAFKTQVSPSKTAGLGKKLEKIFLAALAGSGTDTRKCRLVKLDDAVLRCFATLDSNTKDEEIEDLVYFVLDIYGFHGVPVAISELDIDQIGVDVKQALTDSEYSPPLDILDHKEEHLFLALDKNIQCFPWESIPALRGRPVSRIPSLPFLLDQVRLSALTNGSTSGVSSLSGLAAENPIVKARKVFYLLNPSGDLARTQTHFEPWLEGMKDKAGWKGIVGRAPTELEMVAALKDSDLVIFFGHGGAEQYIRSHKVQHLPKCATTLLWGCSSGMLKDQGDLDRAGTAWNYMIAGCPSLVANLWDVTDKDIDRLSTEVHKRLGLDTSHLSTSMKKDHGAQSVANGILPLTGSSIVQAVNGSRDDCKLRYLTGAAPVVYGLPVVLH